MTSHHEYGLRKWAKGGCDKPGAEGLGPSRMRVSFSLTSIGMPLRSFAPNLRRGGGSKGRCREVRLELAQLEMAGRLRAHPGELGVGYGWQDSGRSRRLSGMCKSGGRRTTLE